MKIKTMAAAVAALGLTFQAGAAAADEGMWTFDNFPSALVKQKYGVNADQAWLDHVRGGTARIPGCSASIVSGQSLVLTNYHCVATCVQNLSTASKDYLRDGYGVGMAEERKCPGMWLEVLQSIKDVTAEVKAAGAGQSGAAYVHALEDAAGKIEKDGCGMNADGFHCQVINFYGGGQYKLYTFRRYDDVRLVFAPEFKTGFFGGDPDNFNFPRYNLDFGLVRVYDNGKPMVSPGHLRWNAAPPKVGEPIFVVGNPGSTQRLESIAQLETQRDFTLPLSVARTSERRGRIIRFSEESPENARVAQDVLEFLENGLKVTTGRMNALHDNAFFASKVAQENELRAKVRADAKLSAEIGDPWADMARAQAAYRDLYLNYSLLDAGAGGQSALFGYARTLVRATQAMAKPAGERGPEFADARLAQMQRGLLAPRPVEAGLEQLNLEFWLSKTRESLGADDPGTKLVLGRDSPEHLSQALVSGSKLADPAERKRLWDGGWAAVQASNDPMIKFVLALEPTSQSIRNEWRERVSGPTTSAETRIAQARFAVYGDRIYPDATFSPRITYGAIEGWMERGQPVNPITTFAGLFDRATGQPPFDLPDSWFRAKPKLNLATAFNFSGTLDITGGNSGSPTLNGKGEVVGAVFDGNIHSIGGDYGYNPADNRSVTVTAAAIQEALDKVYGRGDLVKELNSK